MGKLMKYEIRKTIAVKWAVLGITALLELVFLIGLWTDRNEMTGTGAVLLTMLSFSSILVIGLASVVSLHRDMNTRQSYMLFMTPNSSYRILGAKVLENGISILAAGVFFFGLGVLDVTLLAARQGQLENLWKMAREFLHSLDRRLTLDLPMMASFTLGILLSWFCDITAAYLGEVISAALLYSKRHNGLLSFVLILLLITGTTALQRAAGRACPDLTTEFLVQGAVALACAALMYFLTAQIMERRLSV